MRYLKTSDGRPAAIDMSKVIAIEPLKEGRYRIILRGCDTQMTSVTLKVKDPEMEQLIKGVSPARSQ